MSTDVNPHVVCEATNAEKRQADSVRNHHTTASASEVSDETMETAEDARVVALAEALKKRMPVEDCGFINQKLWCAEKIEMYHQAEELRSTTFGLQLLHVISTSYYRSSELVYRFFPVLLDNLLTQGEREWQVWPCLHPKSWVNSIRSLIQDVRALEDKLGMVEDEDEKRALEEDIAGKILLACWRGVRSEIERILASVANHIATDATVGRVGRKQRSKLLREVGDVFKHATNDDHDIQV
ncbi:hypothetical protein EDC04DRAFT_118033 [Pisolithus marmoratus]|nr:hypothetical protein EDC04DRAFT_118033 [Pisolithus marmoratus]